MSKISKLTLALIGGRGEKVNLGNSVLHMYSSSVVWIGGIGSIRKESRPKMRGGQRKGTFNQAVSYVVKHANKQVVVNTVTSQLTMFMEDKNMMGIWRVGRIHTLK